MKAKYYVDVHPFGDEGLNYVRLMHFGNVRELVCGVAVDRITTEEVLAFIGRPGEVEYNDQMQVVYTLSIAFEAGNVSKERADKVAKYLKVTL